MKLVVIFGPPAVGKMTVGHELARLTGLRLFHNHMTVDIVLRFFEFGDPRFHRLVGEFRRRIFEEVAASNLLGLIFTYVWALDHESDKRFVDEMCEIFRARGGDVYFVELQAAQDERLRRNESEFRLSQKEPKRDLARSRRQLLDSDAKYKLNTDGDFFYRENYLKIENTDVSADEAARLIVRAFALPVAAPDTAARAADDGTTRG